MKKGLLLALIFLSMALLAGCNDANPAPSVLTTPPPAAPLSIYLTSTVPGLLEQAPSTITALDAITGKQRWHYTIKQQMQSFSVLAQNVIYFGSGDGYVSALNAKDGKLRWHSKIIAGALPQVEAVNSGVVYLAVSEDQSNPYSGSIFALNARDGSIKWESPIQGTIEGITADALYVASQQTFYALSRANGLALWQFQTDIPDGMSELAETLNGQLYVEVQTPFDPNNPTTISSAILYDLNASNGSLKWRYPGPKGQEPIMVAGTANGILYLADSDQPNVSTPDELLALNASDGSLKWRFQQANLAGNGLETAAQNGLVYLSGNDGTLYALSEQDGSLRWQSKPANGAFGLQTGTDGNLYASAYDEGLILALNSQDGSTRWKYGQASSFPIILQMRNGILYGETSSNGTSPLPTSLFALKTTDGSRLWNDTLAEGPTYAQIG
jgi:outer membrane protein assembly factor BamB